MKKILLGTSALVAAAAIFAGAANAAQTPKVTVGGTSDFQVGIVGEDNDANLRSGAFRTETEVNVKVDAKTDAGLGYGAQIDLALSGHNDQDNNTDQLNHSWIYVDGAWGKIEGGSTYGVAANMKVDASRIARATGGVDGDFTYFVTPTSGRVIATPDLFLDYGTTGAVQLGDESQEAINKVNYYTPRFSGFQAGVSYLFDTTALDRGIKLSRADNTSGEAENVFIGALNYQGKFSNVGVEVGATGEWGNAESNTQEDLRTYQVGAKVSYMGFSVAGSYANLGDSLQTKTTTNDSSTYFWTVGGAYETGPFGASVTYLASQVDGGTTHNDFSNLSFGVDYKLAAGLTPYAEVNFVDIDPTGTANDNDATVFIAGTQLSF